MGERTFTLLITWMRKMSASLGRQSERKARKMRFSPFWLKMRMPEIILKLSRESWEFVGRLVVVQSEK